MPFVQRLTKSRSVIEPPRCVKAPGRLSRPMTSRRSACRVRTSASPRCPELPVTRTVTPLQPFALGQISAGAVAWVEPLRNPSTSRQEFDGYRGVYHRARVRATRWLNPSLLHADCDCYGAGTDSRLEMLRPPMS